MAATLSITLVIREDPRLSHRPVEALRIALGLAAGDNPLTVVLIGQAVQLLAEDTDDIVDVEILEKYLPSFRHLSIPFVVVLPDGPPPDFSDGFSTTIGSHESIQRTFDQSDRVLVF
jgi:hypothetical protein